jgi:Undecaprenyl-phosphate galactose phosphotransferase WbaP
MSTATILPANPTAITKRRELRSSLPSLRGTSLVLADLGALLVASYLTTGLLAFSAVPVMSLPEMAWLIVPIALFCAIGLYSTRTTHPALELRKVVIAVALASIVILLLHRYSGSAETPVAMIVGFFSQAACVMCFRTLLRAAMMRLGVWLTPAVIIGSGPVAESLVHILEKHKHIGFKPVAILTNQTLDNESLCARLLIEHPANVNRLREEYGIAHAIIADHNVLSSDCSTLTEHYEQWFEQVIVIPNSPAIGSLSVSTVDMGGILGLEMPRTNLNWTGQILKRSLDLFVASGAVVLASPVFALLYLVVRLSSPGPVFYGQHRIGRNGQYFKAWKFRSMVTNADVVLEQHLSRNPELRKEWELTHKLAHDPRVLPIGNLLRKTSLDELPQLWNVIRGDMSLVGPRPIVDAEVSRYGDIFAYYKMVRPGVTGMWQISGRSNTTYAERVRYDEYFVRNWSIWLDLYILFRTVKTVLLREGAC